MGALGAALVSLLLPLPAAARGEWDHRACTVGYSASRAVALGGAVTSLKGDFDVVLYNPAALELSRYNQPLRVALVLDVASAACLALDWRHRPDWRGLDVSERAALGGLVIKGLTARLGLVDALVALGENLEPPAEARRGSLERFPERHGGYFAARLRLQREVAFGLNVFYGQSRDSNSVVRDVAVSYGVLLTSHAGLQFGLAYLGFPPPARARMLEEGRLPDGTLNLGLSKRWGRWLSLSLDVRNLSDEGKPAVREFHFGSELVPWRHLALRAGFFRPSEEERPWISFGLGLFGQGQPLAPDRSFALNYAVRTELTGGGVVRLEHFVTFLVSL
jgi:hypothetical protein